jgi:prepilin-type N-terminal cleavage/methylation domain-containing protein
MTRRPRRNGVTLMEVMIATAILAIGSLAILALFPIGAVNMARAINQNRAADHAQNSDALFRLYWKRAWLDPNGGSIRSRTDAINNAGEPMLVFLDTNTSGVTIPETSSQPSFPVLIDPIGFRTQLQNGPNYQLLVAGQNTLPVRCNLAATPAVGPYTATIRNTTMLDEISYDRNGEPSALTGQLDRGGRYNASWLIQRPKDNVADEVNLTVLVFAGRSPTDTPSAEAVFQAMATDYSPQVDPKPRALTVAYNPNNGKPGFLRGKWIAFSTPVQPQPAPPAGVPQGTPGYGVQYPAFDFYRIAAVTEINDTTLSIEVEQPLRTYDIGTLPGWQQTSAAGAMPVNGNLNGFVVFFDNLFEVFDRGTVSASGIAGR